MPLITATFRLDPLDATEWAEVEDADGQRTTGRVWEGVCGRERVLKPSGTTRAPPSLGAGEPMERCWRCWTRTAGMVAVPIGEPRCEKDEDFDTRPKLADSLATGACKRGCLVTTGSNPALGVKDDDRGTSPD